MHKEVLQLVHFVSLVQEGLVFVVGQWSLVVLVDDVLSPYRVSRLIFDEASLDGQLFELLPFLLQEVHFDVEFRVLWCLGGLSLLQDGVVSQVSGVADFARRKAEVEDKGDGIQQVRLAATIGSNDTRELCERPNELVRLRGIQFAVE